MNYLFIVIDDLRYDVFKATETEALPNKNKFAKGYSAACWTGPSLMSMLSGCSPIGVKTFPFHNKPEEHGLWIPEKLQQKGYRTALRSSNGWLEIHKELFSKGFDVFDVETQENRTEDFAENIEFVQPFFEFIHILDIHDPAYTGNDLWHYSDDRYNNIRGMKKSLRFVDKQLGKMFGRLPENTSIVVTSDHGEMWDKENDNWGHSPNKIDRIKDSLFEVPYIEGQKKSKGKIEWKTEEELAVELKNV